MFKSFFAAMFVTLTLELANLHNSIKPSILVRPEWYQPEANDLDKHTV